MSLGINEKEVVSSGRKLRTKKVLKEPQTKIVSESAITVKKVVDKLSRFEV